MPTTTESKPVPEPEEERRAPESGPRATSASHVQRVNDEPATSGMPALVRAAVRKRRAVPGRVTRERDISRIVATSVEEYKEQVNLFSSFEEGAELGVLRPLPRPKTPTIKPGPPPDIPMAKVEKFEASTGATIWRCFEWFWILLKFMFGTLWDKIRRRDSTEARAVRLLSIVQQVGGTLVKVAQQLSMRVDVLPYEYCKEFSTLLDEADPIPAKEAITAIERATKKPIAETFLRFDPNPIGAASIACVYQGVLKDGRKVAVKVRRPGIGNVFARDLKAMRWLIRALEAFGVVRPGYLQSFAQEFEQTILEELSFRMEAHHQSLFRREARKFKIKGHQVCTAPEPIYELSSNEVMIEEFVDGVWMWEILAAVEYDDQEKLLSIRRQFNIEPKVVAKHLMMIQMWSQYVSLIFHADPHPANIIVQENNKIVFIDFGACGTVNHPRKAAAMDQLQYFREKDVYGFVQASLAFMEPLPPIDVTQFSKELEVKMGQNMQKIWSKYARWYEKTTAVNWLTAFNMARRYRVHINVDTMRAFRANLLYDTLALRICPELQPTRLSKKFLKQLDAYSKRRAAKGLRKRLSSGLITGSEIRSIKDIMNLMSRGMKVARRMVERPVLNFAYLIDKPAFAILELSKLASILFGMLLLGCAGIAIFRMTHGIDVHLGEILLQVASHWAYQVAAGMVALVTVRRIMLRLEDADVD